MKKILFLLMAMVPVLCFGQIFIPDGKYGTQHIRSQKDSVDIIPKGLTGSNNGKRTNIFGKDTAQIRYNVGDSSIYYHTGSQWLKLTGSVGGGAVDSVTFSPSQNIDTVKYWIAGTGYVAGVVDVKCGLISPGTVVHDSLLSFTVSPSIHRSCLDGIRYTTSLTHLTLSAADGTFDRFDIIALEGDQVVVVEGDPSATPVLPQLSDGQTMLTFISIPATATVPSGPFTTIIHDENVGEFTGSSSSVTVDFANFADPYHFVKAASAGTVTSTSSITYTGTDFKISAYNTLRFFIKLKAAFAQNTKFQISWLRDGVTQSGIVTLQNNTYGFLRSAGGYQEIIIPISDFGPFVQDTVDAIKIQLTGSNASGFYLDYIQIQGGIPQAPTGTTRDRFAVSGEDANATQNRYFNGRDQFFFNLDSIRSLAITAREAHFKNIAGSDWLSYSASAMAINPLSTGIPLTFSNIPASDTAMYVLGINAAGRAVLQLKSAISGGGQRFGVSGEDATPAENRTVDFTGTYNLSLNNIPSYQVVVDSSSSSTAYALIFANKFQNNVAIGSRYRASSSPLAFLRSNINGGNPWVSIGASLTAGNETQFRAYSDSLSIFLYNNAKLKAHNLPSGVGTKSLRYDPSNGEITYGDTTTGGGTPTLTSTQIAYGDGSNLMTSSNRFTWDNANKTLILGEAVFEPKLTFNSPPSGQSYIQLKQDGLDNWIITNNYDGPSSNSRLKFGGFNLAGSFQGIRFIISASDGKISMPAYTASNSFTGTPVADLRVNSSGDIITGPSTKSKGLTLEFPTSSESFGVWKTPVDITISSVEAVLVGSSSPSVTFNIAFGSDRTSGTNVYSSGRTLTSTTTGSTFNSSFNDATIPAGSFIWFTTSAQSGTVINIEITINYTED